MNALLPFNSAALLTALVQRHPLRGRPLGVRSGTELKAQIDKAEQLVSDLNRVSDRAFGRFNFLEAINANALIR